MNTGSTLANVFVTFCKIISHISHLCTNCTTTKGEFEPRAVFLYLGMFILLQNHTLHLEHSHSESFLQVCPHGWEKCCGNSFFNKVEVKFAIFIHALGDSSF